jgi:hypothetical protein
MNQTERDMYKKSLREWLENCMIPESNLRMVYFYFSGVLALSAINTVEVLIGLDLPY